MVDIATGMASLSAAVGLVKTMIEAKEEAVRQQAASALYDKLFAAYAAHEETLNSYKAVHEELKAMKDWAREAERYELCDYGGGTFAYEIKAAHQGAAPPHRICANCYVETKASILQFQHKSADGRDHYHCPRCKTEFAFGAARPLSGWRAGNRSGDDWMG